MSTEQQQADRAIEASQRAEGGFDLSRHQRPFVSVPDLAGWLDVDRRTIVGMIGAGSLPAVKVGRTWRIPTEAARVAFSAEMHLRAS